MLIATGETGCTYNAGSTPTVTLSGTAADQCAAFSAAGLADGALVDVTVIASATDLAVFAGASWSAGLLTLNTPAKAIGTLTEADVVSVYGVSLVGRPFDDLTVLAQSIALHYSL